MRRTLAVCGLQRRRLERTPWIPLALVAGIVLAAVAAGVAATHRGIVREDSFRQGSATLLLLGGLVVSVGLGASAFNRDGDSGHLGALLGAGATRVQTLAGVLAARTLALTAILLVWGVALQVAGAIIGLGFDGDLAVHTLMVAEALWLTLLAAAAASTVVPPLAAGFFGVVVYGTAQAMVNLKAAADQDLIGTMRGGANGAVVLMPHIPTSPMLAELQLRDAAGPAVPRFEHNGQLVLLGASGWGTVAWALVWCALFALLAHAGWRRRPVN